MNLQLIPIIFLVQVNFNFLTVAGQPEKFHIFIWPIYFSKDCLIFSYSHDLDRDLGYLIVNKFPDWHFHLIAFQENTRQFHLNDLSPIEFQFLSGPDERDTDNGPTPNISPQQDNPIICNASVRKKTSRILINGTFDGHN